MLSLRLARAGALTGILLLIAGAPAAAPAAAHTPPQPKLVAVTAAHVGEWDRITFQFDHGVPSNVSVAFVDRLVADGSGATIPVPGQATLFVRMENALAHDETGHATVGRRVTFALPNAMIAVKGSDFEGVVSFGIGLARATAHSWRVQPTLNRVVVEVDANFETVGKRVFFVDTKNVIAGRRPYVRAVERPVPVGTPATGLMDRIFAGPTAAERANGLALVTSGARDYSNLSIADGVARVRIRGGCRRGGELTVADEIMPTLRQLANVDWVKIYGPSGATRTPYGRSDSIPYCLGATGLRPVA